MKQSIIKVYTLLPWRLRNVVDWMILQRRNSQIRLLFYRKKGFYNKKISESHARFFVIGRNVKIGYGVRIQASDNYAGIPLDPKLIIEDNVRIHQYFTAIVENTVTIKRNTRIAENCSIITNNHGMDAESSLLYGDQPLTTAPVTIGEECWIGQNVIILPGVEIGKRSIIAAGSVINKSIPSYSIAAGVPARVIKQWNFETHKWEGV